MRPLGSITRRSAARETASVIGVVGSTMIATAMGGGWGVGHTTRFLCLSSFDLFHLLIFIIAHVRLSLQGRYENFMTVVMRHGKGQCCDREGCGVSAVG